MSPSQLRPVGRVAVVMLWIEAVVVLGLAVWEVVALGSTGAASLPSALALIVITLIGAFGIGAFAWGVTVGRSWGRSGGIVVQLLFIAVAVGAATGQYGHPSIAFALGLPAAATLIMLVLAERTAPDRRG